MSKNGGTACDNVIGINYTDLTRLQLFAICEPLLATLSSIAASISTTNLAACVSSKFDQFLPSRFYFVSKRPENFVRIAKFPYAAFGPLFAFHCPLFVTKNNNLGWNRHRRFATHRNMQVQRSRPTVLSARGQ